MRQRIEAEELMSPRRHRRSLRKPHSGASVMTPTCRVRRSISPRTLRATWPVNTSLWTVAPQSL